MAITSARTDGRRIGPVGTVTRSLGAAALLGLAVGEVIGDGIGFLDLFLGLFVLPAAMLVAQAGRLAFQSSRLDWVNGAGFCLSFAFGAILFMTAETREPAMLFFAVSLALAAARGYAGCEILAISNWILRRDDQVGCVVYSPIDALEAAVFNKGARKD